MSVKDYKEGMVAGAKPFEEKFREVQNSSIAALQKLASQNANEVGELIDIAEEHDYLLSYNWKQECQLGSLAEKSILIGFLMDAIGKISTSEPGDTKKEFLNKIYRFLKLNIGALFSKKIDIRYLSNNNDVAFQKLLYLLTCMYFYIGDENFYFLDNNRDVFDCFSVSPKDREEIQGLIEERAKYFDLNSLFTPDEEEVVEEITQEEDNTVGCTLPENLETETFTELYWTKSNSEETIENKIVDIKANFQVDGKLTFRNCKIIAQDSCQINVTSSGSLEFDNCEFSQLRRTESYLIESKGKINFTHCTVYNCWKLASTSTKNFFVFGSLLVECGAHSNDANDIEISKSFIKFDDKFDKVNLHGYGCLFFGKSLSLVDSQVEGMLLDLGEHAIFSHIKTCSGCKFIKLKRLFEYEGHCNLSNCTFNGCECVISGSDIDIIDCQFYSCVDVLILSGGTENIIKRCVFKDCFNRILDASLYSGALKVEECEFRNIKQLLPKQYLLNVTPYNCAKLRIKIAHCVFDNVSLASYGGIVGISHSFSKVKTFFGEISECHFGDINRETSDPVIQVKGSYTGAFNKEHSYTAYFILNCMGLDGLM
ncbi:MAG: hypothetical protein IKP51_00655 [Treponema sp.]|nr:hypothetical protein [Treponema sp.]